MVVEEDLKLIILVCSFMGVCVCVRVFCLCYFCFLLYIKQRKIYLFQNNYFDTGIYLLIVQTYLLGIYY